MRMSPWQRPSRTDAEGDAVGRPGATDGNVAGRGGVAVAGVPGVGRLLGQAQENVLQRPVQRGQFSQRLQRPAADQPAVVDDGDAVGQLLHHVERVRRQEYRSPVVGQAAEQILELADALGVEPDRRLVDDEHFRLVYQGRGEDGPLPHAVGIAFGQVVDEVLEAEQVDDGRDTLAGEIGRQAVHVGDEMKEFAAGQLFVEERHVRDVAEELAGAVAVGADVVAADAYRSGGREQ